MSERKKILIAVPLHLIREYQRQRGLMARKALPGAVWTGDCPALRDAIWTLAEAVIEAEESR